jgi:glycopeptide antibiotics resistance protein
MVVRCWYKKQVAMILPFGVYFIALAGTFSSTPKSIQAALFAVGILLTAEVAWRLITWKKPYLKVKAA